MIRQTMRLMMLLLALCMGATRGMCAHDPLKMVFIDTGYEPLVWTDADGTVKGILPDIFDEIFTKRMGIAYVMEGLPWVRAQKYVEEGERDGFTAPPTPARLAYAASSAQPVVIGQISLFTHPQHPKLDALKAVKTFADLQGFQLVDYNGNSWSEQRLKGLNVYWAPNIDNALKMLASNERGLDALVNQRLVILAKLKRLGLAEQVIEAPGVVLEEVNFHLCIGKKSAYLGILPKFDEVFREIQADGTLQKILERYE